MMNAKDEQLLERARAAANSDAPSGALLREMVFRLADEVVELANNKDAELLRAELDHWRAEVPQLRAELDAASHRAAFWRRAHDNMAEAADGWKAEAIRFREGIAEHRSTSEAGVFMLTDYPNVNERLWALLEHGEGSDA